MSTVSPIRLAAIGPSSSTKAGLPSLVAAPIETALASLVSAVGACRAPWVAQDTGFDWLREIEAIGYSLLRAQEQLTNLSRDWPMVVRTFEAALQQDVLAWSRGTEMQPHQSSDRLALVESEALERELAGKTVARGFQLAAETVWSQVALRLQSIYTRRDESALPFHPGRVGHHLVNAIAKGEIEHRTLLWLVKRLGPDLFKAYASGLRALNNVLLERGIASQITPPSKATDSRQLTGSAVGSPAEFLPAASAPSKPVTAQVHGQKPFVPAGIMLGATPLAYAPADLSFINAWLAALTRGSLERREREQADFVGELFERFLADESLMPEARVAMARLQPSFLRFLMRNDAVVLRASHPFRHLLSLMAEIGRIAAEAPDWKERAVAALNDLCDSLLAEVSLSEGFLEHAVERLAAGTEVLLRRASIIRARQIESAEGLANTARIQHTIAVYMRGLVSQRHLLSFAAQILTEEWVLTVSHRLIVRRQDSLTVEEAGLCERLVRSVCLPCPDIEPETAIATVNQFTEHCREAGLYTPRVRDFLLLLEGWHTLHFPRFMPQYVESGSRTISGLGGTGHSDAATEAAAKRLVPAVEEISYDAVTLSGQSMPFAEVEGTGDVIPDSLPLAEQIEALRKISIGTWFAWPSGEGVQRGRLAAKLANAHVYLLTDRTGRKLREIHLDRLAEDIMAGLIWVDGEAISIDGILTSMIKKMREDRLRAGA